MDFDKIRAEVKENGYCVIPDVVNADDCLDWYEQHYDYINSSENKFKEAHVAGNSHFIQKAFTNYMRYPWEVRTNPQVTEFFKLFYKTKSIITCFGSVIFAPVCEKLKKWSYWVHCDQYLKIKGQDNIKAQLNLTDNKSNMLCVYKKSHLLHQSIPSTAKGGYVVIPETYLKECVDNKLVELVEIEGKVGQLILFDARTWHFGVHRDVSEDRLVVNLSFSPKSKQTYANKKKAILCYGDERRQTSGAAHKLYMNPKKARWCKLTGDTILKQCIRDLIDIIKTLI